MDGLKHPSRILWLCLGSDTSGRCSTATWLWDVSHRMDSSNPRQTPLMTNRAPFKPRFFKRHGESFHPAVSSSLPPVTLRDLTIAVGRHSKCHQHGDITHPTRPCAFEHDPIEINIGKGVCDRLVAPLLDARRDLLVGLLTVPGWSPGFPRGLVDAHSGPKRHPGTTRSVRDAECFIY